MHPHYTPLIKHWSLDQEMTFLNHGSFGATPIKILEEQNEYRKRLEAEPVRFMLREYEELWDKARMATADFLKCKHHDLVFMKNATMGVNTILHSLKFNAGDELLITSHGYGAYVNTLKWYAERYKLKINVAEIPFPIKSDDDILNAIEQKINPRTKLAIIDHVTSATGLIYPVEKITRLLKSKNVEVLIDGAHAPGMLDLDIEKIRADYFVGNCHKWICSPKGSAVMWVNEEKHQLISPLQISHAYDRPAAQKELWAKSFLWPGTDDFTSYLCIPSAIKFMESIFPGGWKALRQNNHDFVVKGRKIIADRLNIEVPCPDEMCGSLATIIISDAEIATTGFNNVHPLQESLFTKYKIEAPVYNFPKENAKLCLRISGQAYNDLSQVEYLAESVREILGR